MTDKPDLRDPSVPEVWVRVALDLRPHPEGGHYRELWNPPGPAGGRGAASSILFLLAAGERSQWHRVDATEIWIWQAGSPLLLGLADAYPAASEPGRMPGRRPETEPPARSRRSLRLGPDLGQGEPLQGVVPAHAWQDARSLGAWTLVSCIVAPAFRFEGFELAPTGWSPGETPDDERQPRLATS